ncbi:hypothetical protein [Mycolicibacterium bacteremicum]|uniref:hypothetical protein n=1 Tax=Mycolicibacterium bacteremicum TaxID=564198 RepID=UPI0010542502|nr:hypothetical protein [Mycolicibacterium bacteremicum]MCV7435035.1 hypothetical protein [Mycolicibacterium bacteremicum]
MTSVLAAATEDPLPAQLPRTVGHSVPAAALRDRRIAEWIRSHGISVTACDDSDLNLIRFHGIRPIQVVLRCGGSSKTLRRAVRLDVSRFIATTAPQLARLAECADSTRYVYLDDAAPLMLGDRRLRVAGLHTRVCDGDWTAAARTLVARSAVLQACGSTVKRIVLSGGPTELWLNVDSGPAAAIVAAVDEVVRTEAARWNVPRPAITMAALT